MNYKNISELAANGDYDKCLEIIKNKIDMDSIDDTINIFNKYLKTQNKKDINVEIYNKVLDVLNEIKSNTLINLFIDKEPYIKDITDDKIINLTGQSGSGKSTYAKEHLNTNDYLIVDTDDVLSEDRFKTSTGINKELGKYFRKKFDPLPNLADDFDLIYKEILDYCKKYNKTIVIDCAQFHCVKEIGILKGKLIVIRTCIDNCYNRTIKRYKYLNPNCTSEELNYYKRRKKGIYVWYKSSNEFIKKIETFVTNRDKHLKSLRSRLKNNAFSLFSNNCLAGFIYHDLGLEFLSPTINLGISPKELILFMLDLKYYLNTELIEVRDSKESYPVGILKGDKTHSDIKVKFAHYLSFKEAKEKWIKRCKKVNYKNIVVMMEFYDGVHDEKLIKDFNQIPYKKMILTHKDHKEKYTTAIHCFDDNLDMSLIGGKIFRYNGLTGKRFYDEFDYVGFLNKV